MFMQYLVLEKVSENGSLVDRAQLNNLYINTGTESNL
jgi:hypothetical protein